MKAFLYDQAAHRIIFAAGAVARLREELERISATRPIFICTPGRRTSVEETAKNLSGMSIAVHAGAKMHVPIETVHAACDAATSHRADSIVAFGGGSAIDTSKATALLL